jgi:protein-disulfide isomerase
MHAWLFERGGGFTRPVLRQALQEFGYDIAEFERVMQSDETLARVRADVDEATQLGVYYTPTVFINGVELRGWHAPNAIARAIEKLAATDPPALTAAHDRPPPGREKLVEDWRRAYRVKLPPTAQFRARGPEDARVRVVLFGDFCHKATALADAVFRDLLAERDDLRYEYHYFPFNRDCNPAVKVETKYPQACYVAEAAEAAGRLGGAPAYWAMHAWLFDHYENLSEEIALDGAREAGLDPEVLRVAMETPEVRTAVVDDAKLARGCGVKRVPTIFINGRHVLRWRLSGENLLPAIVAAAAVEQED